jgi:hypothetical protein
MIWPWVFLIVWGLGFFAALAGLMRWQTRRRFGGTVLRRSASRLDCSGARVVLLGERSAPSFDP